MSFLNLSDPLVFENFGGSSIWERLEMKADSRVVQEGDETQDFYYVLSGSLKVSKTQESEILPLAVLKGGDFFGEGAIFSGMRRMADVDTLSDAVLLKLSYQNFLKMVTNDAQIAAAITLGVVQGLNARLMRTNQRLATICRILKIIKSSESDAAHKVPLIFEEVHVSLAPVQCALFSKDGTLKFHCNSLSAKYLDTLQKGAGEFLSSFETQKSLRCMLREDDVFFPVKSADGSLSSVLAAVFPESAHEEDIHLLGIVADQLS